MAGRRRRICRARCRGCATGRPIASAPPPAGWQTDVTGPTRLEAGTNDGKGTSTHTVTQLGALGTLLVLAFVFASFIARLTLVATLGNRLGSRANNSAAG